MSKFNVKMLATLGVLTAMEIVLSRFLSISAWNIKIGFSFVPIVLAAMLYGPLPAAIIAALGDFLGALLFPIGPYFPGFTLTAFLTGAVFGAFLKKERGVRNTIAAVFLVQFVLSLLLNTFWIHVLYRSPFVPLLGTRLLQTALLCVVQFVTIRALSRMASRLERGVAV